MSEFIAQLFTDFTTSDSLIVLAFLFGAFLIGLFTGRASRNGQIKKLRKIQQQQADTLANAQAEQAALAQKILDQESSMHLQANNLQNAEARVAQLEQERNKYHTDWQSGQAQIQQLEIELLEHQNQQQALEEQLAQAIATEIQLQEQVALLQRETAEQVIDQNAKLDAKRLQLIEDKISLLEKENQQLHAAIEDIQTGESAIDFEEDEIIEVQEGNAVDLFTEPEENTAAYTFISSKEKANIAKAELKKHFGQKLTPATSEQKDSLQNIDGIGPFIEEQLNSIGIYTFKQISQFDDEIILLVTNAIQFFPGRIKRDDWQGQASKQLIG